MVQRCGESMATDDLLCNRGFACLGIYLDKDNEHLLRGSALGAKRTSM